MNNLLFGGPVPIDLTFEGVTVALIYGVGVVFCRVGTMVMVMPSIGDSSVPTLIRLLFALTMSLVITPVVYHSLPPMPGSPFGLFTLIGLEILAGLLVGGISRILVNVVMHVAGMIMAFQSSLASAILFDPNQGSQGSILGIFYSLLASTLIFTSDLHHLLIQGVVATYIVLPPGIVPVIGDYSNFTARVVSDGFLAAIKISSPLIIVGFFLYFVMGLMSRLMPSMQVFFIAIPVQLMTGFFVMMITLSTAMLWYLAYYRDVLEQLFFPGGGS